MCNKEETIDYIGILVDTKEKLTIDEETYLQLTIRDCSNTIMYATLWKEIACSLQRFNRPVIDAAVDPKIIAMTAMKVKLYGSRPRLQLEVGKKNRSGDCHILRDMYLNPNMVVASMNRSLHLNAPETLTTITNILNKSSTDVKGKRFSFYGEISSIVDNDWCYIACPICTKGLSEIDGEWFCPKDDIITDVIYSVLVESNKQNNTTAIPTLIQECIVSQYLHPQQQQVIPVQQAFSSMKRQLQLTRGEGSTSFTNKIAKTTSETAKETLIMATKTLKASSQQEENSAKDNNEPAATQVTDEHQDETQNTAATPPS
ncbi:hypothetical protein QVD17_19415 [Tagetes erecta]|uniref:Uncharacterized protein n=1 Tax=Tagetes erecta TaxID=13708 RepID=A0AAD8KM99_TARER|nr:hypothetical protein QVD17_19415 [Tagetes erecta]